MPYRGCPSSQLSTSFAQSTAFTYQGRLNAGAGPASGSYDLAFALYDAAGSGTPQGNALTNSATAVSNGLFTVTLDFGNQFPGADRWLEIAVRTNGAALFTTLSPRQKLTAAPYAITAGSVPDNGLSANVALLNRTPQAFTGINTFAGKRCISGGPPKSAAPFTWPPCRPAGAITCSSRFTTG